MYSNKQNIPWVEKYRPEKFDEIVLEELNRKIFKNILEKKYVLCCFGILSSMSTFFHSCTYFFSSILSPL